ncbi:MAG: 4Fe-4S dicluster domain-containing protein [Thermoleophilia bacterium]|nr:4Fe-4S dicluster domain-containing protein [Thermoleophilia bacterium]
MADRPAQALDKAVWRLCREYYPELLPVTDPEGRFAFSGPDGPERMSRLIKKVALWLGAELVGIAELDQRWVYADRDIAHRYAIVCAVPHDRRLNATAPSHLSGLAVAQTYSRLKAVTTDLPLVPDKPISFGVHEFCMACESCARYCPAAAVPYGEPTDTPESVFHNPGYRKWYVDPVRCLLLWAANRKKWITCGGKCIAVCPWNQPQNVFHDAVRWLAIHFPRPFKRWLVWADRKVRRHSKRIGTRGMSEVRG